MREQGCGAYGGARTLLPWQVRVLSAPYLAVAKPRIRAGIVREGSIKYRLIVGDE